MGRKAGKDGDSQSKSNKEGRTSLMVWVSPDVVNRFKVCAAGCGMQIQEAVEEALRDWTNAHAEAAIKTLTGDQGDADNA